MNRIAAVFNRLKSQGEKALIPFITAGDPDLEATRRLALEMAGRGADILELGIPFSDPLADGPTIQAASNRAVRGGDPFSGSAGTGRKNPAGERYSFNSDGLL